MNAVRFAVVALAFVLASAPSAADTGSTAQPKARIKNTKTPIEAIGMDGSTVAYSVEGNPDAPCRRIFLWDVQTGGGAVVKAPRTCEASFSSVVAVAVAGARLAWIANATSNSETSDALFTATWTRGKTPIEKRLATTLSTGDVDCVLEGSRIGGLVGGGNVLAYNGWRSSAAEPGNTFSCAMRTTAGALRRIGTAKTTTIAKGGSTLTAASTDAGRIAVGRDDGTVALYSQTGALLRTLSPTSLRTARGVVSTSVEIALYKGLLAALTETDTLEVFNANTGALVKTLPVAGGAAHLDVHDGIAVYASGTALHAVSIKTGKDIVAARSPSQIQDTQIEKPGAVYSFNTPRNTKQGGNLGYLPTAVLAGRLR